MSKLVSIWNSIRSAVVLGIGKIHWKLRDPVTLDEQAKIRELLCNGYYIILTRRRNHLSTFFVGLASWVLTFKWGYWSHALMNLEDEVKSDSDFRLVEAIGSGVKYSTFDEVFDVNSAVLLKPRGLTIEDWNEIMEKANTEIGKPYDTMFDLKSDTALSCVELVRTALEGTPRYEFVFAAFEAMITARKNLSPDMFYECPDFEVVYEVRH